LNDDAQLAVALLAEHGPRLHALFFRITLREDASEDLLQELFLRLSRGPTLSRARDSLGYAIVTATRLAFDWRHSQRRHTDAAAIDVANLSSAAPTPLVALQSREELQLVLDEIGRLPPVSRDIVVMRYLESRSYDEIAASVGRSVHHTRALCHRAITRLRSISDPSRGAAAGGVDDA
jgi:RNA polymerase sigma factor (sigma-70 family)